MITTGCTPAERSFAAAAEAWHAARQVHDLARESARLAMQSYRHRPTILAWDTWHAATLAWERAAFGQGRARVALECARAAAGGAPA